jgi:hypothetical protein
MQAPRQPKASISTAVNGQPTVLAKPATSVMPVMARPASRPYQPTTVAKAASYKPLPMPTPSQAQASSSPQGPCTAASASSPEANSRLVAISTVLPPRRSRARPAAGPTRAEIASAREKAANTVARSSPRSAASGAASKAGR